MLFVRFFVRSYLRRASGPAPARSRSFSKSTYAAAKGVEREVFKAMSQDRGSTYNSTSNSDSELNSPVDVELPEKLESFKNRANEQATGLTQKVGEKAGKAAEITGERMQTVKREISQSVEKLENFDDLSEATKEIISKVTQSTKETAASIASLTEEKAKQVVKELREATSSTMTATKAEGGETQDSKPVEQESEEEKAGEGKEQDKSKAKEKNKKKPQQQQQKSYASALGGSEEERDAQAEENSEQTTEETTEVKTDETTSETNAASYEANIDEATSGEEKKAEAEMQPEVVKESKS